MHVIWHTRWNMLGTTKLLILNAKQQKCNLHYELRERRVLGQRFVDSPIIWIRGIGREYLSVPGLDKNWRWWIIVNLPPFEEYRRVVGASARDQQLREKREGEERWGLCVHLNTLWKISRNPTCEKNWSKCGILDLTVVIYVSKGGSLDFVLWAEARWTTTIFPQEGTRQNNRTSRRTIPVKPPKTTKFE